MFFRRSHLSRTQQQPKKRQTHRHKQIRTALSPPNRRARNRAQRAKAKAPSTSPPIPPPPFPSGNAPKSRRQTGVRKKRLRQRRKAARALGKRAPNAAQKLLQAATKTALRPRAAAPIPTARENGAAAGGRIGGGQPVGGGSGASRGRDKWASGRGRVGSPRRRLFALGATTARRADSPARAVPCDCLGPGTPFGVCVVHAPRD